MKTVRVFFAKEGRLKYISHLDVTRCLARVFKRSRLPIWYTQGFNPHAYLTFALPLPLGVESCCESFDFRLTEEVSCEEVTDRLNAVLPMICGYCARRLRSWNRARSAGRITG